MSIETRAQIGIFDGEMVSGKPTIIINRNTNGHPTGGQGVVSDLLDIVPQLVAARGVYDAEWLAAQLVQHLVEIAPSQYSYGVTSELHTDIRFFYGITPDGIVVYDARSIESLSDLETAEPMFETAWVDPETTRELEKEVRALEDTLSSKKLQLEGLKRKQLKRK